jgi:hypothetical protein
VIAVHKFWRARFHKDPAITWLRRIVQALFKSHRG